MKKSCGKFFATFWQIYVFLTDSKIYQTLTIANKIVSKQGFHKPFNMSVFKKTARWMKNKTRHKLSAERNTEKNLMIRKFLPRFDKFVYL